ncbi:TldD/PmbA family protein [candidate division KSB1 bacterium]|nr:TldD/PmbA family protein [candidate division KSB1 bacterium]MBL7093148.1 TldD/PmbA family protein [candidate division KSB1 bacterium]
MDYKNLAERLVKKCLKKGADAAEVYIETERELSIEVRNGDVETVQETSAHGAGFRIFVKGKMAFSNCNDFSENALDNAVKSAVKFAQNTTPDENNVLPDEKTITNVEGLYDPEIAKIPMEKKIELAKEVEKLAMKDSRITKSAGSGFFEGEGEIFLANSNGLVKSYKSSGCALGVSVVAEKGDQKSSGGEYCTRRFFADLISTEEIAKKAAKEAYSMLDPQKVKTQKAAVIFHPDVAYAILGGILRAINGEKVLQGASFLAKSMDQKIATDLLTIIDDGTRAKGMSSKPFDGEGVPTQKRVIVDNGVLKGFMYNTIVAKRAGVKSTGNASRGGFTSLPGIGSHNFYIAAGESTPEQIIRSTKNGLLLKGVTGYGINPVNGNFSGGANGFWIKNGRIAFPVKGLTIAGTAEEMLNGIDMVGNDLDLNRSFTAPTLRIREMQVGGE